MIEMSPGVLTPLLLTIFTFIIGLIRYIFISLKNTVTLESERTNIRLSKTENLIAGLSSPLGRHVDKIEKEVNRQLECLKTTTQVTAFDVIKLETNNGNMSKQLDKLSLEMDEMRRELTDINITTHANNEQLKLILKEVKR